MRVTMEMVQWLQQWSLRIIVHAADSISLFLIDLEDISPQKNILEMKGLSD